MSISFQSLPEPAWAIVLTQLDLATLLGKRAAGDREWKKHFDGELQKRAGKILDQPKVHAEHFSEHSELRLSVENSSNVEPDSWFMTRAGLIHHAAESFQSLDWMSNESPVSTPAIEAALVRDGAVFDDLITANIHHDPASSLESVRVEVETFWANWVREYLHPEAEVYSGYYGSETFQDVRDTLTCLFLFAGGSSFRLAKYDEKLRWSPGDDRILESTQGETAIVFRINKRREQHVVTLKSYFVGDFF